MEHMATKNLSPREHKVAVLVAQAKSNKDMQVRDLKKRIKELQERIRSLEERGNVDADRIQELETQNKENEDGT
jgi:chorismate mutase